MRNFLSLSPPPLITVTTIKLFIYFFSIQALFFLARILFRRSHKCDDNCYCLMRYWAMPNAKHTPAILSGHYPIQKCGTTSCPTIIHCFFFLVEAKQMSLFSIRPAQQLVSNWNFQWSSLWLFLGSKSQLSHRYSIIFRINNYDLQFGASTVDRYVWEIDHFLLNLFHAIHLLNWFSRWKLYRMPYRVTCTEFNYVFIVIWLSVVLQFTLFFFFFNIKLCLCKRNRVEFCSIAPFHSQNKLIIVFIVIASHFAKIAR